MKPCNHTAKRQKRGVSFLLIFAQEVTDAVVSHQHQHKILRKKTSIVQLLEEIIQPDHTLKHTDMLVARKHTTFSLV